ncbi:MAG: metallophosphoesterase [Deltaproteobacteria bacterium]|nr:metallophosphoesterase [Deltaproteobacteria bacterium]
MFTLAHLSDLHATPLPLRSVPAMSLKQTLGWLKWTLKRSKEHRTEVLDALVADLQTSQPDHVVVTGDLTNLGMAAEFPAAVTWLQRLGGPQQVSIVPGNHDTYTFASPDVLWHHWREYLRSDAQERTQDFPTLRVRGYVALIGVSSAQPTNMFHASGTVGKEQLARLEQLLHSLAESGLCRVVLLHHPLSNEDIPQRRRLSDAQAVQDILQRAGADLVLHGHIHQTSVLTVPGRDNDIPVIGVRSSSAIGHKPHKRSHYHLYRIERLDPSPDSRRFRITMVTRGYDEARGCFQHAQERVL